MSSCGLSHGNTSKSQREGEITVKEYISISSISSSSASSAQEKCTIEVTVEKLNDYDEESTSTSTLTNRTAGNTDDEPMSLLTKPSTSFSEKNLSRREYVNRLLTFEPGKSQVELLSRYIQNRRLARVPITLTIRRRFLNMCRERALKKGYNNEDILHIEDIQEFRDQIEDRIARRPNSMKKMERFLQACFCHKTSDQYMLEVLDKAIDVIQNIQPQDDDEFHFRDFNLFHTRLESQWIWIRNPILKKVCLLLAYYAITPIIFCKVSHDEGICQQDHRGQSRPYYGVVSSLYFASATLSTVGYGDLTVSKDNSWNLLIGVLYMIFSLVIAAMCFTSVVREALKVKVINMVLQPMTNFRKRIFDFIAGGDNTDEFTYKKVQRLRWAICIEIILRFGFLNLVGYVVSRLLDGDGRLEVMNWTWLESLYWVVQTSSTIGYGDMPMPYEMRLFQISYLTLGAFFVADAIGRLGSLEVEVENARRFHGWKQRQLSKSMIKDLKPLWNGGNESVDQFEFVVSSLLNLGKVSPEDITLIMDKFRDMCVESTDPGLLNVKEYVESPNNLTDGYNLPAEM